MFKEMSPFLFESFMRVYPVYGFSAESLFQLLADIFDSVPPANREQVVSFLADWTRRRYPADFRPRPQLFARLMALCDRDASFGELRTEMMALKAKGDAGLPAVGAGEDGQQQQQQQQQQTQPQQQQQQQAADRKKLLAFSRWDSQVLADTLTVCGHELFRSMAPHEMCGDKSSRTVLEKQIALFSHLSNLVVWSVTTAVFPLALLKKFIKLAHLFFKMNNLNYVAAVVTGLNSGHVQTMKQVWADLPEATLSLFNKYDTLVSPMRNFSAYRTHLQTVPHDQPCYPYLAVLTRDLLHIDEGNPTVTSDGSINYAKISLLGMFIEEWRVFQTRQYVIKWNAKVAAWIQALDQVPNMSEMWLEQDPAAGSTSGTPSFLRKMSTQVKGLLSAKTSRKKSTETSPQPSPSGSKGASRSSSRVQEATGEAAERSGSEDGRSGGGGGGGRLSSLEDDDDTVLQTGNEIKAVRAFLAQKGMQKFEHTFEKHSIRPSQLKDINEYDLIAMGIVDKADRGKLVQVLRGTGGGGNSNNSEQESGESRADPEMDDSDGGDVWEDGLAVRVACGDNVKIVNVNLKSTPQQVEAVVGKSFDMSAAGFTMKLVDLEGDMIRIKSQAELEYALLNYKSDKVLFHLFPKN